MMKLHAAPLTVLSFSCLFVLSLSILNVGFDDRLQADDPPLSLLKTALQQEQKPEEMKRLRVRAGAPFKIALFADLHFGENAWTDWGPQQDVNSVKVMSSVLDDESPDFVIYLGDVITANSIPIANASLYWDEAISPTRARGIPWASIFGNHDDAPFEWPMAWFSSPGIPPIHCPAPNASSCSGERYCSFGGTRRIELMKKEIENNLLTLSKTGPKDLWPSISNYVLQLSSSDDPESPVLFMYFFDSGGGSYPEVISNAQAEWFQHVSDEINPDSRVPEVVFWHVPSKAYKNVAPRLRIHKPCVGSINKEKVAAQEAELGIMDMLAKRSSVKLKRSEPKPKPNIMKSSMVGTKPDGVAIDGTCLDCGRLCLQGTTMDWTGAVPTRNSGYATLGILAMAGMGIGGEELEFWRSMISPSISSHG